MNRPELNEDRAAHPEWYDGHYMNVNHPLATKEIEKRTPLNFMTKDEGFAECPECQGYGGWHLIWNAYGEGKHFNCHCSNCNGRGYTQMEPGTEKGCQHEFTTKIKLGNCYYRYVCAKCGTVHDIDSGD